MPGCVSRSSPPPAATEQYADLAAAAPLWTLVDDRALASLSDSVTPAGVVGVCRFLDRPVGRHVAATAAAAASRSAPTYATPATPAP